MTEEENEKIVKAVQKFIDEKGYNDTFEVTKTNIIYTKDDSPSL